MEDITIRDMVRDDVPAIVGLLEGHNEAEEWHDTTESFRSELEAMFNPVPFGRPAYVVAVNKGGDILGVGGYSNAGFDEEIYGLFWGAVHRDHVGKGIGKMLVATRLERIRERGGKVVLSTVRKTWHLERFGFIKILPRESGYFLMMLELT